MMLEPLGPTLRTPCCDWRKAPQRKDARGLPVQQRCLRRAKDLQGPESGGAPSQVPNWKQCTKFIEYVDTDQEIVFGCVWLTHIESRLQKITSGII